MVTWVEHVELRPLMVRLMKRSFGEKLDMVDAKIKEAFSLVGELEMA